MHVLLLYVVALMCIYVFMLFVIVMIIILVVVSVFIICSHTNTHTYTCTKMNSIERVCVPYKTKSMQFIKTLKWMHTYILQTSITSNSGYTCKDSLKSNNNECRSFMTLHAYDTFSYVHKMFPG